MDSFESARLSNAGKLETVSGEQECLLLPNVTLSSSSSSTSATASRTFTNGILVLTTLRLGWISNSHRNAYTLPLSLLSSTSPIDSRSSLASLRAHRVYLNFTSSLQALRVDCASTKDRDRLIDALRSAVARREWSRVAAPKAVTAATSALATGVTPGAATAGIAGATRRVAEASSTRSKAIATGFSSLEGLRRAAEELVSVAKAVSGPLSTKATGDEEKNELLDMLAAVGIDSPVTKEQCGGNARFFREQLAREAADFLRAPLTKLGGVLPLADAYCLVCRNRASAQLVSPGDFREACRLLGELKLGISERELESGVKALMLDKDAREEGAKALRELVELHTSLSALDVVRLRKVPLQRALIMLEEAEKIGVLARDDTPHGLRFFPNRFDEFVTTPLRKGPGNTANAS